MIVQYGFDSQHYIDVTLTVLKNCLFDDHIFIPAGDEERAKIFGDPYPGHLKHIVITDHFGMTHTFLHNRSIKINIPSISRQLTELTDVKFWYNTVGKSLTDKNELLNQLRDRLNINYGDFNDEMVEQTMCAQFVTPESKVLELGGNIGRVTLILSSILNNEKNMVTFESHPESFKKLEENVKLNGFQTNIENAALSSTQLIQQNHSFTQSSTTPHTGDSIPEGWMEVRTLSFDTLTAKYNIQFDTLVADCEGALYFILKDNPSILKNMKLLILENDYQDIEQKSYINQLFEENGFKCVFVKAGGWGCCYDCFWEVWKKE